MTHTVHNAAAYTELDPDSGPNGGLWPGGDCGGDTQASESWTRKFQRPLDDGLFAVITVYFFVTDPRLLNGDPDAGDPGLTRHTEFSLCRDPHDVDGTEEFSDATYVTVPGGQATEEAAHRACAQVDAAEFTWDGKPPIHYQQIT